MILLKGRGVDPFSFQATLIISLFFMISLVGSFHGGPHIAVGAWVTSCAAVSLMPIRLGGLQYSDLLVPLELLAGYLLVVRFKTGAPLVGLTLAAHLWAEPSAVTFVSTMVNVSLGIAGSKVAEYLSKAVFRPLSALRFPGIRMVALTLLVYVLTGLFFATCYSVAFLIEPGSFKSEPANLVPTFGHFMKLSFSVLFDADYDSLAPKESFSWFVLMIERFAVLFLAAIYLGMLFLQFQGQIDESKEARRINEQ